MGRSERGSDQRAQTPEAVAAHWLSAELLEVLRGFRVDWDDGSVGVAEAMAIFVRTAGFGSGHQKLELLTVDDLVAILPEERESSPERETYPQPCSETHWRMV